MSVASRERQHQKRLLYLRRGFTTWEEFRSYQRAALADWLKRNNTESGLPRRALMNRERLTGYCYPIDRDIYLDEVPFLCDPKIYE